MPSGKPSSKTTSKSVQQLLFTKALLQTHPMAATKRQLTSSQADDPEGPALEATMDRILQEVTAVGCRLEGMDSNISALTAKTKSIGTDMAGFQNHVMDLEHRILAVEDRLSTLPYRDQELLFLCSKVVDMEDRSRRDNVCFFGFPEHEEGSDVKGSFRNILPVLIGLAFEHWSSRGHTEYVCYCQTEHHSLVPSLPAFCDPSRLDSSSPKLTFTVHTTMKLLRYAVLQISLGRPMTAIRPSSLLGPTFVTWASSMAFLNQPGCGS
ncbi:hypothetical protein NDU88_003648 [Pleurodeles waltl]|uniref:Uncharacterized protein n=1 Tax=Pleurodeles waltl TaxID=8319 RepID=A0AAV7T599_PLEWA|nr:hypothetical protein NDU88_003648 [Pleurodeles waltl]